jgi:hypothetical protein
MDNTTTKKTAKYYRDIFSGNDIRKAVSVLPEVIKKYGHKRWTTSKHNDEIKLKGYTEFEWNHQIEGFGISEKSGRVYVDIYWQGDSTDGNESEWADVMMYGKTIPAEHEWLGNRTYCKHSDLRISAEEFRNALKAVAKYLSPEEMKIRKEAKRKAELSEKIFDLVKQNAPKNSRGGWGRDEGWEQYWNGRTAVQKVLENNPEFLNKTFEELKPIVEKVYANNEKSDYSLRGGWYNGEKKYNLAY